MKKQDINEGAKKGKQDDKRIAHMPPRNPLFQASRLEGKVKNMGIKNLGNQMKKGKRGDR